MNNDSLLTSAEIAKKLLPQSTEWTLIHVATALDEITGWYLEQRGHAVEIDRAAVVNEVREMNMAIGSRDRIVADLEQVAFKCEWVLPTFDAKVAGFNLR